MVSFAWVPANFVLVDRPWSTMGRRWAAACAQAAPRRLARSLDTDRDSTSKRSAVAELSTTTKNPPSPHRGSPAYEPLWQQQKKNTNHNKTKKQKKTNTTHTCLQY